MVAVLQHWILLLFKVTTYGGITFIPRTDVTLLIRDSPRVPGDHHHWQSNPFLAIAFLRRFCQSCLFRLGLHFSEFRNSNISTEHGRQPCVQPPSLEDQSTFFCDVTARPLPTFQKLRGYAKQVESLVRELELHETTSPGKDSYWCWPWNWPHFQS
jgi:hypothetical protein